MLFNNKKKKDTVTKSKIPVCDISEFYYTCENINYNASFLRYKFSVNDEKYVFEYEIREKKGDYGPTDENDIIKKGTYELSNDEKNEFILFLKDGEVSLRKASIKTGETGPWMYLYWKNDKGKYQVFNFPSYAMKTEFEKFCTELMNRNND